ncbi:MAG: creatininase family protein, partial [Caulobacteraceae bacterium]
RIARKLGNALVAPVVAYVPEGTIDPPTQHMRFPGTITVPPEVFRQTLESAAMSFALHGFKDVVFLGDHGGYQDDLKTVADSLNRRWTASPARAHYIAGYYGVTQTSYVAALRRRGYSLAEIGTHAGLADTALTLAIAPAMVRREALMTGARHAPADGVHGDPRRASAALGALGADAIVDETTTAIEAAVRRP